MAKLQVTNNIFRYKDTGYNIAHISAIRLIQRNLTNKKIEIPSKISFEPVFKYFIFTLLGGFMSFISMKENNGSIFLISIIISIVLAIITRVKYIAYVERKNKIQAIKNRNNSSIMYGIRITFSNGTEKDFESTNEQTIIKINDAIRQAMNKENVSISLDNVNIEIHDSNNVDIAKIGV